MENLNFTAIDFETMTPERASACAIGLVRVENNVIVQKIYSLIKPIPDDRETTNSQVNGITPEMVENAPTFEELWPFIGKLISGHIIVAHNASFDLDVLAKVTDYYGVSLKIEHSFDTFLITNKSLEESCRFLNINLENHHDALCDATACANILLKLNGVEAPTHYGYKPSETEIKKKTINKETKRPLNPEDVENTHTPFFMKRVVLTGNLQNYPSRQLISETLRLYGADINCSISKKTDIVIVGDGAGPAKMKKIEELKAQGYDIRIMQEPEFIDILEKFNIK